MTTLDDDDERVVGSVGSSSSRAPSMDASNPSALNPKPYDPSRVIRASSSSPSLLAFS